MNSSSLKNIWMLTKKNITLYIKKGPVLIFGLMFPFFMLLSWILGRELTLTQIFIGIVSMTSFFTATAISPVIFPIETREKSLERLISAPISLREILSSIILASSLYSIIITSIVAVLFLIPIFDSITSPLALILIFIGILLMGFLGSTLGLLISAKPTDQTSDVMVLTNLVKFPLLFIGGVFIPLTAVHFSVAIFYFISPITYLTELLRNCLNENALISREICLLGLVLWISIIFIITYLLHKRTLPKRFSETSGSNKKKLKRGKM